ncbi:MAG: hypothetical protein M1821_008040 [Bathelium mastoideum]|nr:MAG: hypothetical protein M1821_008040 [Bathelium mastoideum]KAI9693086.1 MAG: hypothetical protein M1822_005081 [Bathelium mastoideum]
MCLYDAQNTLIHPCAPVLTTSNQTLCIGRTQLDAVNDRVQRQTAWWRRASFQLYTWGRRVWAQSGSSKSDEYVRLENFGRRKRSNQGRSGRLMEGWDDMGRAERGEVAKAGLMSGGEKGGMDDRASAIV